MRLSSKIKTAALTLLATGTTIYANNANNMDTTTFATFADTITSWTGGSLGIGLATTMLLMGGAIGVAKNSPMPALSGVAGAAFLHWGPEIIRNIMTSGLMM